MKKITLSILAFGVLILTAQAQTTDTKNEKKEVRFGVKAGLNIANLTDAEDSKVRANFHIGGVGEIWITDKFSIQPELIYSRQGVKSTMTEYEMGFSYDIDIVMRQDYINVPIMAKYYLKDGFNIQAGPQVGFLVTSEIEGKASVMGTKISSTQDIKSEMSSVDFGINLGLGYELPIGLFFDARYNLGITNIFKESYGGYFESKNRVFQLSTGYKF